MAKVFEVNLTVANDDASTSNGIKSYTADRDSAMRITCNVPGASEAGNISWRHVATNGDVLVITDAMPGYMVNTEPDNSKSQLMITVLASNNEGEWQCVYQPPSPKSHERISKFSLMVNINLHADLPDWINCPPELDTDSEGESPRCRNGGICLMNVHDNSPSCLCPSNTEGKLCIDRPMPVDLPIKHADHTAGYAILGTLLGMCLIAFIGLLVYNHKHLSFRRKIRMLKRQGKEMKIINSSLGDQEKLIDGMNYIRIECPYCQKGFEHCLVNKDQLCVDKPDIKVTRTSTDDAQKNDVPQPSKSSIVSLTIDTSLARIQGPRSASMPESPSILIPCYDATCQQCMCDLRKVAYPRTVADQLARMHGKKFSAGNDNVVNAYLEQYSKLASRRKNLSAKNLNTSESGLMPAPIDQKLKNSQRVQATAAVNSTLKEGEMRMSVSQPQLDSQNRVTIQPKTSIITHTHDENTPKRTIREAFFANNH